VFLEVGYGYSFHSVFSPLIFVDGFEVFEVGIFFYPVDVDNQAFDFAFEEGSEHVFPLSQTCYVFWMNPCFPEEATASLIWYLFSFTSIAYALDSVSTRKSKFLSIATGLFASSTARYVRPLSLRKCSNANS